MGEVAIIVALLLACLVALILVLLARREADATRKQALQDVESIKAEARMQLDDAIGREERVTERERELAEERRRVREVGAATEARAVAVEADRAAARTAVATAKAEAATLLESVTGMSLADARAEQVRLAAELAEHEAAA